MLPVGRASWAVGLGITAALALAFLFYTGAEPPPATRSPASTSPASSSPPPPPATAMPPPAPVVELPPRPDLTPGTGEALGLVTFSERREMVLALRGSEPTLPRNEALSHPVQRSLFELSAVLGELYYDLMNAGRTEEAIELRYLLVVADAARHTYRTDDGIMAIVRHEVLASPQADAILARPGARPLLQPDD